MAVSSYDYEGDSQASRSRATRRSRIALGMEKETRMGKSFRQTNGGIALALLKSRDTKPVGQVSRLP